MRARFRDALRERNIVMNRLAGILVLGLLVGLAAVAGAQEKLPPIQKVEISTHATLQVNGKPFFPLMVWLQEPNDFALLKDLNHNTVAGFWWSAKEGGDANEAGKDPGLLDYAQKAWQANLYFIPSFHADYPAGLAAKVAGRENTLGWIQGDEPDMAKVVSDAVVEPGKGMNVNPSTPFSRVVDGDKSSWTVLQPLTGGEFTIKLAKPVTVQSLAVALTISKGLAVGKDVVFLGDGKELAKAALENKAGPQKVELPSPATFQALTVRFTSEVPGEQKWGSVGEVEGYDKDGKNVLLSKPRKEPSVPPAEILAAYSAVKAVDKDHPVFMNLTASFMKVSKDFDQATKDRVYPEFAKGCDMMGFDTYPIYGTGWLGHILWPAEGTAEMRSFAKPNQPLYAWIETNRGSRWISPAKQPEVKPEHTRFEVWSCIIRGASGIAYFTHKWKDPDGNDHYMQFAPKEDKAMLAELKRLNGQIARLAPAILGETAKVKVKAEAMALAGGADQNVESALHLKATIADGATWIFAQNIDLGPNAEKLGQFQPIAPRAGKATISVEGLKAGTKIEVVDENRTIDAEDGKFSDDFAPLTEHVYKVKM